jgi:hypothetical protein
MDFDYKFLKEYFSFQNLMKIGLSVGKIDKILDVMNKEYLKQNELDKDLIMVLDEENKEIFNVKCVKEFYIRKYRNFKLYLIMNVNSWVEEGKFITYIKQLKKRKEFSAILELSDSNFSNVTVLEDIDKYFFNYITYEEIHDLVDHFLKIKKKVQFENKSKSYYNYIRVNYDYLLNKEIQFLCDSQVKMVCFYFLIRKYMSFEIQYFSGMENISKINNKINRFNICLYTWYFFENLFGEMVSAILCLYLSNYLSNDEIVN